MADAPIRPISEFEGRDARVFPNIQAALNWIEDVDIHDGSDELDDATGSSTQGPAR